jgi:hypothetical protein
MTCAKFVTTPAYAPASATGSTPRSNSSPPPTTADGHAKPTNTAVQSDVSAAYSTSSASRPTTERKRK